MEMTAPTADVSRSFDTAEPIAFFQRCIRERTFCGASTPPTNTPETEKCRREVRMLSRAGSTVTRAVASSVRAYGSPSLLRLRSASTSSRSFSSASSSSSSSDASSSSAMQEPSKRLRQVNIAIDRRGLLKVGKNPCTDGAERAHLGLVCDCPPCAGNDSCKCILRFLCLFPLMCVRPARQVLEQGSTAHKSPRTPLCRDLEDAILVHT